MVMYGAPVWQSAVTRNRRIRESVNKLMRRVALRVMSAYRTVSLEAAAVLAGIVPFEILIDKYATMYERYRSLRSTVLSLRRSERY